MRIFTGVPWTGASNKCGAVDNCTFQCFHGLYFWNL